MDTQKRQQLQDIYSTKRSTSDDFTPQVSPHVAAERKRDMRRQQLTTLFMGIAIVTLAIFLVYFILREYTTIQKAVNAPEQVAQSYIHQHSLTSESEWVLDFSRAFAETTWDGEGERPFNALYLKKAAYNVVLAEEAFRTEKYDRVVEYYNNALEIVPDLEDVKMPLCMAYFHLKKYDLAIELLGDSDQSDLPFDMLNNLGAICIEAKKYEQAENYLNKSLQLKPGYVEALKNLSVLYKKQKKTPQAISAFEKYLDINTEDTDMRYSFGLFLTQAGEWELASEQLLILTELIPDDATLFRLLAQVQMKRGKNKEAIHAFQRASQLTDPSLAFSWMNSDEFDALLEDDEFQQLMKSIKK